MIRTIRIKNTPRRATRVGSAYLDPTTGSVLVDSTLAGISALAAALSGKPQVRFGGVVYLPSQYLRHLVVMTNEQRRTIDTLVRQTRHAAKAMVLA